MIPRTPVSIAITIIVIINLVLFATGVFNAAVFWIIVALAAFYTYFVMPKMK